jgi:hypothetical protein
MDAQSVEMGLPMGREPFGIRQFEEHLLHSSLDALSRERCACDDCGRTPLAGETVHVYEHRRGERVLCELCAARSRRQPSERRKIAPSTARGVLRLPRAA